MKKIVLLLVLMPTLVFSYEKWIDPNTGITWTYMVQSGTVSLLNSDEQKSRTGDLIIPSMIDGKLVTGIGENTFKGCSGLTSVVIPEGVTSIGFGVFAGCTKLEKITLPESLRAIDPEEWPPCSGYSGTFEDCVGLKSVNIPSSVTNIGDRAFCGCSGLTSVTIPSSVTSIGQQAFSHCSGLTSVTIPEGVCQIEYHTFGDCVHLETIILSSGLQEIGSEAFCNCFRLNKITLHSDIEKIKPLAFENCNSLAEVHVVGGQVDKVKQLFKDSGVDVRNIVFYPEKASEPVVKYTIAFDAQGGGPEPGTMECEKGQKYGTLPIVEKEGAIFKGWYTAKEDGNKVFESTLAMSDVILYARWRMPSTADEEIVAGGKVTIETGLVGYNASGLPKGLKYDAQSGKITGTTKSVTTGAVEVVFTKAGGENVKMMTFEVRPEDVFIGCGALATGSFQSGVKGVAGGIPVETYCETGVKSVSVAKLPAGMKYDSKNRQITGAPNKAGDYEAVLTVTTMSGAVETVRIPVSVAAMPKTVVGSFNGFVSIGDNNLGTFTLTSTDTGKMTARVVTASGMVSFSGICWDSVEGGVYRVRLTTKKGEVLTLALDSKAAWDVNQLIGEFTTAMVAATKTVVAVPSRTYSVLAHRNAFEKTWYFAVEGDAATGWTFAFTTDAKTAALTVTLKADGTTSIAGKLPNGTDAKGKEVSLAVSASGYANVGGLREGTIFADFAPIVTVNKGKRVLAITANLWFDCRNDHAEGVGGAKFVE